MEFKMDMSMEKERSHDLFPEGVVEVEILSCTVKKSKAGNDMLVATIVCPSTGAVNDFMFTMIKEKRWVLKSLLEATRMYKKDNAGYYIFDTDKLEGQHVLAQVINVEEEYTDRQMQQQKRMRSQIRKFIPRDRDKVTPIKEEDDVQIPF
jgi:hypothetical protein